MAESAQQARMLMSQNEDQTRQSSSNNTTTQQETDVTMNDECAPQPARSGSDDSNSSLTHSTPSSSPSPSSSASSAESAASAAFPVTAPLLTRRVKIYSLGPKGNWEDKGTGFLSFVNVRETLQNTLVDINGNVTTDPAEKQFGFIVMAEVPAESVAAAAAAASSQEANAAATSTAAAAAAQPDATMVQSDECLMEHALINGMDYHKQGETILTWCMIPSGHDVALSFQEADICEQTWKLVQRQLELLNPVPPHLAKPGGVLNDTGLLAPDAQLGQSSVQGDPSGNGMGILHGDSDLIMAFPSTEDVIEYTLQDPDMIGGAAMAHAQLIQSYGDEPPVSIEGLEQLGQRIVTKPISKDELKQVIQIWQAKEAEFLDLLAEERQTQLEQRKNDSATPSSASAPTALAAASSSTSLSSAAVSPNHQQQNIASSSTTFDAVGPTSAVPMDAAEATVTTPPFSPLHHTLGQLHSIFRFTKHLLLLNNVVILEILFSDDVIDNLIGILEYDPIYCTPLIDLPGSGAATASTAAHEKDPLHNAGQPCPSAPRDFFTHRTFLKQAYFKSVIPFYDATVSHKIHQSYKVTYLKDVILASHLDDNMLNTFTQILFANMMSIITRLTEQKEFLTKLFATLNVFAGIPTSEEIPKPSEEPKAKTEAAASSSSPDPHAPASPTSVESASPQSSPSLKTVLLFLQELVLMAKNVQYNVRDAFYRVLDERELFATIECILEREEAKLKGKGRGDSSEEDDEESPEGLAVRAGGTGVPDAPLSPTQSSSLDSAGESSITWLWLICTDIISNICIHEASLFRTYLISSFPQRHSILHMIFRIISMRHLSISLAHQLSCLIRLFLDPDGMVVQDQSLFLGHIYEVHLPKLLRPLRQLQPRSPDENPFQSLAQLSGVTDPLVLMKESIANQQRDQHAQGWHIAAYHAIELLSYCALHHNSPLDALDETAAAAEEMWPKSNALSGTGASGLTNYFRAFATKHHVLPFVLNILRTTRRNDLVCSAIRFFRICVGSKDEHYTHEILKNNLLEGIFLHFQHNGNRYNLLNSVVCEMMHFFNETHRALDWGTGTGLIVTTADLQAKRKLYNPNSIHFLQYMFEHEYYTRFKLDEIRYVKTFQESKQIFMEYQSNLRALKVMEEQEIQSQALRAQQKAAGGGKSSKTNHSILSDSSDSSDSDDENIPPAVAAVVAAAAAAAPQASRRTPGTKFTIRRERTPIPVNPAADADSRGGKYISHRKKKSPEQLRAQEEAEGGSTPAKGGEGLTGLLSADYFHDNHDADPARPQRAKSSLQLDDDSSSNGSSETTNSSLSSSSSSSSSTSSGSSSTAKSGGGSATKRKRKAKGKTVPVRGRSQSPSAQATETMSSGDDEPEVQENTNSPAATVQPAAASRDEDNDGPSTPSRRIVFSKDDEDLPLQPASGTNGLKRVSSAESKSSHKRKLDATSSEKQDSTATAPSVLALVSSASPPSNSASPSHVPSPLGSPGKSHGHNPYLHVPLAELPPTAQRSPELSSISAAEVLNVHSGPSSPKRQLTTLDLADTADQIMECKAQALLTSPHKSRDHSAPLTSPHSGGSSSSSSGHSHHLMSPPAPQLQPKSLAAPLLAATGPQTIMAHMQQQQSSSTAEQQPAKRRKTE